MRVVRAALVILAVVAAATVANVALLGAAAGGREPAGTLSPRAALRPAAAVPADGRHEHPERARNEPGERADD